ncbi:hypothetical protein ACE6H2_008747 [Prunus campanulata]
MLKKKVTVLEEKLKEGPVQKTVFTKYRILTFSPLKTSSYDGKKLKFSANGFPQLEFLELEVLEFLEELEVEESAMPKLRSLQITDCKQLWMLPEEIKYVTTLSELVFKGMPRRYLHRLPGEDHHKVQNVPSMIKS